MHAVCNDAMACRPSVHDQIIGTDIVMIDPAVDRTISKVLAHMSVRARERGHSTGLGQDKSKRPFARPPGTKVLSAHWFRTRFRRGESGRDKVRRATRTLPNVLTALAVCLFDARGVASLDAARMETRVGKGSSPSHHRFEGRRRNEEGGVPI